MQLKFSKMHGLGNDFVVIDGIHQAVDLSNENIRFIANRRTGIGCDQILLIEQSHNPEIDFNYRIFNADGSEVAQCGNGARCIARFLEKHGLTDKKYITVQTAQSQMKLELVGNETVSVNMGVPKFEPKSIPFNADGDNFSPLYSLSLNADVYNISLVSMGNPHAVVVVEDVASSDVQLLGSLIGGHEKFPEGCNVGFMEIVGTDQIKLRVFERGVGETPACGSGACAAVVSGQILELLDNDVEVILKGGVLGIGWQGKGTPVIMTGSATFVFDGVIAL